MSRSTPHAHATARQSPRQAQDLIVALLVTASAVGGALAGCHPTGTPVVDPLETAAFAAGFTFLVSRAAPGTWVLVGVTAVVLARGWLLVPAGMAALLALLALAGVFSTPAPRWAGAAVGALGGQAMLRWPPYLFHGLPTVVAATLVTACAVSAWRRSSGPVRRRSEPLWSVELSGRR